MGAAGTKADKRAVVTWTAPPGAADYELQGGEYELADGDVVAFGRGSACGIRFAYVPVADEVVPRVAGRLVAYAGRVFVEAVAVPRRPSLQVRSADRPPVMLAVGEGYSPATSQFDVLVQGSAFAWRLAVTVRRSDTPSGNPADAPTKTIEVDFTPKERAVLSAYMAPQRRGRSEPATHREVAEALNYHPNTVREILYRVWAKLFAADVPMPDIDDKRVAIVEAIRLHQLLTGDGA